MPTAKVSISLPKEVLETADQARRATGESRSELFRRAIDTLLREERRRQALESYQAGYVAEPEDEYEVDDADRLGSEILEREVWD